MNPLRDCFEEASIRDPLNPGFYAGTPDNGYETHRGDAWISSQVECTGFHTILPPNSPSCTTTTQPVPPRDRHHERRQLS